MNFPIPVNLTSEEIDSNISLQVEEINQDYTLGVNLKFTPYPDYNGEYTITPKNVPQILSTKKLH